MRFKEFLEGRKQPCSKCHRTDYTDIRAGLCDRCAFPTKTFEGLKRGSRFSIEVEHRGDKYYGYAVDKYTGHVLYRSDGRKTWDDAYTEVIGQVPSQHVEEAVYPGNVGMMEMFKFYQVATQQQKDLMAKYIKDKLLDKAWELLTQVTGTQLKDPDARA